ncbi:LOW QUALITY PROTEIN: vitellogenin-4 [Homalodisca vitripennis]|uniref:LOW QUALITY PROTEIN: vitellogenin-4 n=1 Tax=Homalodisca vitripennis TaxID=197043 RepID=UPI001EEAB5AC|nr:LOW QUALITY PROTEIN: vitellogenin-4 [Homalodisca vitripennis]
MMRLTLLCSGIFLSTLQAVIGGEHELFSANQEIKFLWHAQIKVGSNYPMKISSEWNINAQLIAQTVNNLTTLQLIDIKSDEDLGESHRELSLPFRVVFQDGVLESLTVAPTDTDWSINIKRALLSLLQLDIKYIAAGELAFISEEVGLYGKCKAEYIVQPFLGNLKHVKKILDLQSCWNHPITLWSSSPKFICPNSYQTETVSYSEREYFIDMGAPMMIQNITARGSITLQPFQAQAEAHYSLVSQTLVLKDAGAIEKELPFPSESANNAELIYKELLLDATHGIPPANKTEVLQEISDMLKDMGNSLWWEVGARGLNNETVHNLINLMWWLELEDWEQLYSTVTLGTSYQQETMQHLFWELVPVVGSSQSALFIRDLVKTERIKGLLAGRLLVNFPFYQRKPTEDLLTQCEELLHLKPPVGKDVRYSAILSFATLIDSTCARQCKADTIDRYAKLYLDRFTDSDEYEERMLYLQGLSNIALKQILDYLTPTITGQATSDHHIQFLATWAVLNTAYTNPDKAFELFWPLLNNRSQTLEMRVAAMTILILSKPTSDRLISLYWYMQTEPSLQLYNYFYTTIKSLASTTYPCYYNIGLIASQLSRSIKRKSTPWATGNYLLDYEDKERGYGGMLQLLSIGSERTGLPNVFIFMTEQHSLGVTTSYALYIKAEGVGEGIKRQLYKMTVDTSINFKKIAEFLTTLKMPVKKQEEIHLELIFKIDGKKTVITQYLNTSSFHNISTVVRKLSSVYFEFSVNYQRLMFPLFLMRNQPTDLGVPSLIQTRSGSLISARGSVSQDDEGRARNTELDLRYSWNGITSLQVYNPMSNKWYGATRSRSLHVRLPFAIQLHLDVAKNIFTIKTIQHRDYMAGSRLGVVWHAVFNPVPHGSNSCASHVEKEEWTMDSQDLGARLGASVFNCPGRTTITDALHLLKKAFMSKEKNYQMVPGGVALLGIFSLKEQLAFQPPGSNCGLMLSVMPLLSQVEPVLTFEKNEMKLQMSRKDGLLWEIKAVIKKNLDGNRELTFKLYHTPTVRVTSSDIWRVIQFEGAFVLPSSKASVFKPPSPLTGYMFISWGDSSPTHADKAAVVDVKVEASHNNGQDLQCPDLSPVCLQSISELATQQEAIVQYVNLPDWLITAAHALFPNYVQTGSSSTTIDFSSPALPPWKAQGLCAINSQTVLTMDNTTKSLSLTSCFTVLLADCSEDASFAVLVKKMAEPQHLAMKLYLGEDIIELLPSTNGSIDIFLNESIKLSPITEDYHHGGTNETNPFFSISVKQGGATEVELHNGVVVQHYTQTIVALVPGIFRGYTCGLCADFNSDTNNEPVTYYTQC